MSFDRVDVVPVVLEVRVPRTGLKSGYNKCCPHSVDPRGGRWAGTKTPRYEEFFDLLPVGKSSM